MGILKKSDQSLSQEQFDNILEHLEDLSAKLRVSCVLLINSSGRILAEKKSNRHNDDTTILATLAAGSFSASAEMAKQLGEQQDFKMVLHEGEKSNIFISSVNHEYFLIIVFEKGVAVGMVRLFAKRTIEELRQSLAVPLQDDAFSELFDQKFSDLLGEKLDDTFKDFSTI
jgi:predicted regulator of Ras-like GTPase activity (Roadblock/LC7/MglB family)